MADVSFYDVKARKMVAVPMSSVKKTTYSRKTKDGKTQTRYALRAKHNGTSLTKFVSMDTFNKTDVPTE